MGTHHRFALNSAAAAAALLAGTLAAASAAAQGLGIADLGLSQSEQQALLGALTAPASSPGISLGSPVGFGASWGELGFGLGGQTIRGAGVHSMDGSFSISGGVGDAQKLVGLEINANIISLRQSFGDDGSFGAKLHTALPGRAGVAVGVENIGSWGQARTQPSSVFVVGTKVIDLAPEAANKLPFSFNLGLGDGHFRDPGHSGANAFGGVSIVPSPRYSLIADWSGRALSIGTSFVPFTTLPLTASAGISNVTGRKLGGAYNDPQFTAGIGYSFRY